jgi:hypothetical protein
MEIRFLVSSFRFRGIVSDAAEGRAFGKKAARFALPDGRGDRCYMSGGVRIENQSQKLKSKATDKSVRPTHRCYLLLTMKFTVLG